MAAAERSAVRLNLVGPLQAIALQADVCAALPRLHEELLEGGRRRGGRYNPASR